jgi:hypothetical protein
LRNAYESISQKETEPGTVHKNTREARNCLSSKRTYVRPRAEIIEAVSIKSRPEMRREEIATCLNNRY